MHSAEDMEQPDWFILTAAAQALGGAAWELDALPEPERTYWRRRGLVAHNARIEAQNTNRGND